MQIEKTSDQFEKYMDKRTEEKLNHSLTTGGLTDTTLRAKFIELNKQDKLEADIYTPKITLGDTDVDTPTPMDWVNSLPKEKKI